MKYHVCYTIIGISYLNNAHKTTQVCSSSLPAKAGE